MDDKRTAARRRILPSSGNWTEALARFAEDAQAGDEFVVSSPAKKELLHRALARLRPGLVVSVTVDFEACDAEPTA